MRLVKDKSPHLSIIYRSSFLDYYDGRFSFDNVYMNKNGKQEIKENFFLDFELKIRNIGYFNCT